MDHINASAYQRLHHMIRINAHASSGLCHKVQLYDPRSRIDQAGRMNDVLGQMLFGEQLSHQAAADVSTVAAEVREPAPAAAAGAWGTCAWLITPGG